MTAQKSIELVLFFTRGVSLRTWDEAGMLAREVALYHKLLEHGVRVSFVTYGDRSELNYSAQIPGIRIVNNGWSLPTHWYQRKLALLPPRGNVFKSNQVDGAEVALAAARRAGGKFVARCGYLLSAVQARTHGPQAAATQKAHQLEQHVFSGADRVCVTTPAMAQAIQEKYKVAESKISVVPNYVEIDRFQPLEREPNKTLRIGFVGRLAWEKNLNLLIEAAAGLDVELLLVGEGPLKEELASLAANTKVKVNFLGRMPNVALPDFLNSCDVFVLPSLYEGHPKALLEAMACGLAVIGTRVPGIHELIADGENGLLCEPDASSLRQALERSLGDSALRVRLGSQARLTVEQHFALERIVSLELGILASLVA
ncbi:MAG: glycosyltransferase family 4 protein [Anaerolineales bacterium]